MIRCPLCESVQADGHECQVCGKRFTAAPSGGAAATGTLLELEPTRVAPAIPLQVAQLPELEGTRLPAAPELPVQRIAELESTALADGDAGPIAALPPELVDRGRAEDPSPLTAAPEGPVTCRYCRNVQATGLLCDRCGMRLPRLQTTAPVASGPVREGVGRCSRCRLPGRLGAACAECGAPMSSG